MPKPKNEGYLGNINVKRQGVTEEWTDDKVQEYLRCTVTLHILYQHISKLFLFR